MNLPENINILLTEDTVYYDNLLNLHVCPGLRDHIYFFLRFGEKNNIKITTSILPKIDSTNLVFEGLNHFSANRLALWCEKFDKKIWYVQSEHLHLTDAGELAMNGKPWWSNSRERNSNDDITYPFDRFISTAILIDFISAFVFVADSVDCDSYRNFFPNMFHLHINFPKADSFLMDETEKFDFDLFFSVPSILNLTDYRKHVLQHDLKSFKVLVSSSEDFQDWKSNLRISSHLLHIPKSKSFSWPSSMRIWLGCNFNKFTFTTLKLEEIDRNFMLAPLLFSLDQYGSDLLDLNPRVALNNLLEMQVNYVNDRCLSKSKKII